MLVSLTIIRGRLNIWIKWNQTNQKTSLVIFPPIFEYVFRFCICMAGAVWYTLKKTNKHVWVLLLNLMLVLFNHQNWKLFFPISFNLKSYLWKHRLSVSGPLWNFLLRKKHCYLKHTYFFFNFLRFRCSRKDWNTTCSSEHFESSFQWFIKQHF